MMLAANITVIFMFMEISTNLVVSQFSNGYRNWFKFAPRNVPLYPLCLPDGSPCLRMTDCCSSHCRFDYEPEGVKCTPSPCGCPQPPWSPEIDENCRGYGRMCDSDRECCSGYCLWLLGYHGGGGRRCFTPPCTTPC